MIPVFRIVALLEGLSYLGLLFVGVPMKYLGENESIVKMLGMPHGVLFMGYLVMAYLIKDDMSWDGPTLRKVMLASVVPFGTFWVERRFFGRG